MEVKILGRRCAVGEDCPECVELRLRLERALSGLGLANVPVQFPKDLDEFLSYGVTVTPALMVNGEIKVSGRVPREAVLRRLLQEELDGGGEG